MNSLTSYIWPRTSLDTDPIHVCQENRGRISTMMCWALRPFGLFDIPMEVTKHGEKTIVKIETEQSRIVDGVKCFSNFSQKTFKAYIPVKIETEGSKSIIIMELTNWMFCDCDYKKSEQFHFELIEEEEEEKLLNKNGMNTFNIQISGSDEAGFPLFS